MEELKISEEKGLQDVQVFKVCEYDAVAAHSLEEAIAWYKETTGLGDEDLFSLDEVEYVSPDYMVFRDESMKDKISVREIVGNYWNGEPFIVYSTEF